MTFVVACYQMIMAFLDSAVCKVIINPFPSIDSSKMIEFANDNFRFDKNVRKFSKWVGNTMGKGEISRDWEQEKLLITRNFSFSHSVFKRLALQTCKKQGLFGKVLNQ